jgi:putative ABC transport system permease protein
LDANIEVFKDQIKSIPNVINATVSGFLPVKSNRSDSPVCKVPEVRQDQCVLSQHWRVDDQYIPTLGMEITRGRNFDAGRPADSLAVILNERAAQMLFPDKDPIGQDVYSAEAFDQEGDIVTLPFKVIGVVKDFNYESLRDQVSPLTLFLRPNSDYISIRVNGKNLPATIARLEKYWKDLAPGVPFSFEFLDTRFDAMYRTEIRVGQISNIFSFLSILIACLGLFGLATFTAERRTKEIGIRKVMGASTGSVVLLLSRDLLRLVLISLIFAIPVSWWAMNAWLKNFAYHIEVQWWVLLAVSALAVAVAFLTVSIQGLRAALMDPVKSLRTE